MYCASDVPRSKMTDLREDYSYGSSNGFCLRVHDGAIVVGFRFHRTDRGETAASLRTGQRPTHLIAPKALLLRLSDSHKD